MTHGKAKKAVLLQNSTLLLSDLKLKFSRPSRTQTKNCNKTSSEKRGKDFKKSKKLPKKNKRNWTKKSGRSTARRVTT